MISTAGWLAPERRNASKSQGRRCSHLLISACPWWLSPKSLSMLAIPMSTHQIYSLLHRQLPKLVGQNPQNVLDPGRAHIIHDSSKVALLSLRNWCWTKMLMPMHWWLAAPNLPCWCSYLSQFKICNADVVVRISHSTKSATPMLIIGGKRGGLSSELSSSISRRWTGRNHVDF